MITVSVNYYKLDSLTTLPELQRLYSVSMGIIVHDEFGKSSLPILNGLWCSTFWAERENP